MAPVTGKCLCGDITYRYTQKPALTAICHCTDCQKWTGSHYTWNVVVPQTSFKVTSGEPSCYTVIGASGKKHPHYFCGKCGSCIYSEPEMLEGKTLVKAGTINGNTTDGYGIGAELFMRSRKSYLEPIKDAVQNETM